MFIICNHDRYAEVLVDEPLADVLIKEVSFLTVVTVK